MFSVFFTHPRPRSSIWILLSFFASPAFSLQSLPARLSLPSPVLGKISFHFLFSISLRILLLPTPPSSSTQPPSLPSLPLSRRSSSGSGDQLRAQVSDAEFWSAPSPPPASPNPINGLLPSVELPPAAWSSVYALAFPWLLRRPGHRFQALLYSPPAIPSGPRLLPLGAQLPCWGQACQSADAAQGPPARLHQASASAQACWVLEFGPPREKGWGWLVFGAEAGGWFQAPPSCFPTPWSEREGEGALLPLQVGVETALLQDALVFLHPVSGAWRGNSHSSLSATEMEGKQKWIWDSHITSNRLITVSSGTNVFHYMVRNNKQCGTSALVVMLNSKNSW